MKKLLRFLAVMGALWNVTPKAAGAEAKENVKAKADVSVYANAERVSDAEHTFGELTLAPHASIEKGDYKLGYSGMFYNYGYTDHTHGDPMTLDCQLRLDVPHWTFQTGRMMLRPEFASFMVTPFPTSLGNDIKGAGASRIFTGTHVVNKDTGLGVGFVANDACMAPSHWDTGLLTWEKKFGDGWGLAAHVAAGSKGVQNAGFTLAYMPTDKTAFVAEGIYKDKTIHGILGTSHKLTDDLTLFAGLKLDRPEHEKVTGWATAGLHYNLGKGFSVVGAVKQDIDTLHKTHGIIGLKYAGNFGI